MFLRAAEAGDGEGIAHVHVQAWRETYRGIMPDKVLDALSLAEGAQRWAGVIGTLSERRQLLTVAVDDNGRIVGFAGAGPTRDAALATAGEIYAINLVNEAKRARLGARLMLAMADGLVALGFGDVGLWVLEQNLGARAFYERLGGSAAARHQRDFGGTALSELGYVWRDIGALQQGARALSEGLKQSGGPTS
jgi:ribosomal protein S18 acetylase RimI-like enzyme